MGAEALNREGEDEPQEEKEPAYETDEEQARWKGCGCAGGQPGMCSCCGGELAGVSITTVVGV